ncbi:MAG TPA: septum formation initiator family protein [bacterium]|nr:septum formation initiator family protein [bacterium]
MAKKRAISIQKLLIITFGTIAIGYAFFLYCKQKSQMLMYEEEIKRLTQENVMLEKTLEKVNTPFMTEKIARDQLGLMKQGEYKVILKEGENVSR